MAKKLIVNKSEEIRSALAATPAASAKEVVATLKAKGIDVSENLVYSVKKDLATKASKAKASNKAAAPAKAAPAKAAAPPSSNGQKTVNKSEEIRSALAEAPGASAKDVVAALKAKGIDTNENLVYSVKQNMAKKKASKKAAAPAKTVAPAKIAVAASSNGHLGVGASIAVAKAAAEKVGGWSALKEIVDALQ